jgi:hypothetical protein
MTTKIYFNNEVYSSELDMPHEVRERYRILSSMMSDADGNNIPDIIQDKGIQGLEELFRLAKGLTISNDQGKDFSPEQFAVIKVEDRKITINGREFSDVNEIPQEIRRIYDVVIKRSESGKYDNRGISRRQGNPLDYPRNQRQQQDVISPFNILSQHDSIDYFKNNTSITILLILIVILICSAAAWLITSGVLPESQIFT